MSDRSQYTAQQFIDAITDSAGIISTIAKRVGCDWHTAKKYITTRPTIEQAYDDECQKVLDLAETVVLQSLRNKDEQMAKWYLTMKGRERGYAQTQRNEVTGAGGGAIVVDEPALRGRVKDILDKYGPDDE